jgi:methylenetetrahydrofolate reductase (NADPH)
VLYLSQIHRHSLPAISFELFPPKTPKGEKRLFEEEMPKFLALKPAFMSCTYGATGGTRDKTLETVLRLKEEFKIEAVSHMTCVGAGRDQIATYLDELEANGILNVIALRGDPPRETGQFMPHPDGFAHATDLVRFIKQHNDGFELAVAGYPEGHPECPNKLLDWERCGQKIAAGADMIITQLFYDTRDFFEFREYLWNRLGLRVPIVPGILPILNTRQIKRFCAMCCSRLPPRVLTKLDEYVDDDESCLRYGIELATEMCNELIQSGVPGVHFYTLNRSHSVGAIMRNLREVT